MSDDVLRFADELPPVDPVAPCAEPWRVAIVDDDDSTRDVTRLALANLRIDGRPLAFVEAASAEAAIAMFADHPDIALGFVDMVMEEPTAGLRLIREVREGQGNRKTRLVVRTGQPGHLPEDRVVGDYDINDYREKTELSAQKLRTLASTAIRSYRDIVHFESTCRELVDLVTRLVDEKVAGFSPHAEAAADIAALLGRLSGLPATRADALREAAMLRDLGLLRLPGPVRDALLQYEDLDGEARRAVDAHPGVGAALLDGMKTPEGRLAALLARQHHERWDGGGYPEGLSGEAIALESRLLAVANFIDAELAASAATGATGMERLGQRLAEQSGRALDPRLAQLAIDHLASLVARRDAARARHS